MAASLTDTRAALAEEWKRRDPGSEAEIASFYAESECLAADLDAWHRTPERQEWTAELVELVRRNAIRAVLDIGAGGGHDLAALGAEFPELLRFAVEPNVQLRQALERQGIFAYAELAEVPAIPGALIVCVDVLEHLPEPDAMLAQIAERVEVGGLFVEATATEDQGTPLHLPSLVDWAPAGTLHRLGFAVVEQFGRLSVWEREQIDQSIGTLLLCAHRDIAVPTVEALLELVGAGWPIKFVYGDALIDRARAKAVSAWYRNDREDVFLMVDDDIVFRPEDAQRVVDLAREKRSIACGAYPVGDGMHMASRGWQGQELHWGPGFEPVEIRWPATGFMAVHRDVVEALIQTMEPCYPGKPDAFWPMFQPFAMGPDYLSEDYAFGQRAMDLGFTTWLDPKTILVHLKVRGISVLDMPGAEVRTG